MLVLLYKKVGWHCKILFARSLRARKNFTMTGPQVIFMLKQIVCERKNDSLPTRRTMQPTHRAEK
jgi:hypothetical protein